MSFIVKSKANVIDINQARISSLDNIGNSYAKNRVLSTFNEQIDINVSKSSKFVFAIVSYLFQSSNYTHSSKISNGKSIWQWLFDIFCWLSILLFVILLAVGIATPIVNVFKGNETWAHAFSKPSAITALVFSMIFLLISIMYLILVFKIKKKNSLLALDKFVEKKLSFCLKFRFFFRLKRQTLNIVNKKEDILIIDNFEIMADNDKWIFLQMLNLMGSIFFDMRLVLSFEILNEKQEAYLREIIETDFKFLLIEEKNIDVEKAFENRLKIKDEKSNESIEKIQSKINDKKNKKSATDDEKNNL